MNYKKPNTLRLAIISIVAIISVLIGHVVYYDSLLSNLRESTFITLNEVMQQEKNNFTESLSKSKDILKGYAELITIITNDEKSLVPVLNTISKNMDFEYIFFVNPNGYSLNSKGDISYVGDRDYFIEAMAGETVISDPVKSKIRDDYIIAVATPIIRNGNVTGVLVGTFKKEKLNELFMTSYNGFGYTYIATNTGELVAKTNSIFAMAETVNLFDLYCAVEFYEDDSYEIIRQNLIEGIGGHTQYRLGEHIRFMSYDKLEINGWNIFSTVNPTGVMNITNVILRNAIILTSGLGAVFIGLLLYNVINQKRFTKELTKMAYVDDVTGYRSFGKFKIDAGVLLKEHKDYCYMIIKMDIEKFKLINEIYSMELGNKVLKNIAETLELVLNEKLDAFGRIHADEFIVLLSYHTDDEWREKKRRFEEQFSQSCSSIVTFNIVIPQGRYKIQKNEKDFNEIYEKVNFAHRLAKISDNRDLEFDEKINERAIREKEMENSMENALLTGEFHMFLQPQYRLGDGKVIGAEALVRWITEGKPMVYPCEFIPLFEQNGFITKLDLYMFEQACKTLKIWIDGGIDPIIISVNFSRFHLSNDNFVEELSAIADKYYIPYNLLEIELSETDMFENLNKLEVMLEKLHNAGFILSVDDFGTGHSSLGMLKNILVDVIKIDKMFFDQSKDLERSKTIITSILDMARRLDIRIIAECVETQEHIDILKGLGCEMVQGYYYAKPMTTEQMEVKLLRNFFSK